MWFLFEFIYELAISCVGGGARFCVVSSGAPGPLSRTMAKSWTPPSPESDQLTALKRIPISFSMAKLTPAEYDALSPEERTAHDEAESERERKEQAGKWPRSAH
jgi:hypothetical protein